MSWLGARRWDAVALRVDSGGWPVLVCQRTRAVWRGSGAGPAQGAPESCASVSWWPSSENEDATVRVSTQSELGLGYRFVLRMERGRHFWNPRAVIALGGGAKLSAIYGFFYMFFFKRVHRGV